MSIEVWFWLDVVSPHMAGLVRSMAELGASVTYVVEREMSPRRAAAGWNVPDIGAARLVVADSAQAVSSLAASAPFDSVHICMGVRGNALVAEARRTLAARGLRQWAILETVDDSGWRGWLKRLEYGRIIRTSRRHIEGILAIGHTTTGWLVDRGMPSEKVFPFAYFLPDRVLAAPGEPEVGSRFRFLFVGQFIERKRFDLLLAALKRLATTHIFELLVVGSGPLEVSLRASADELLPGRVQWLGQKSIDEIPSLMAQTDCLVLPSRHDGWGAVVSEALMVGTPSVCSDACGVAAIVRASGQGGVFRSGSTEELAMLLAAALRRGPQPSSSRLALATWARCLGATAGALYLDGILRSRAPDRPNTIPPWMSAIPPRRT